MARRNVLENKGKLLFTYMVDNTMCPDYWDIDRHGSNFVTPEQYKQIMKIVHGKKS